MAFVSTNMPRPGLGHTLLTPLRVVINAMEWIRESNRMGREFEQLSHKSDARLAKMGLKRDQIAGDIIRRSDLF